MKVFIDTNIFLDALLNRDEGLSKQILKELEKLDMDIFLSDISVINIVYIIRKDFTKNEIREIVNILLKKHKIVSANNNIIFTANNSNFKDFEDGVQYFCAKEIEANLIITNNKQDFKTSKIDVLSAKEFYALYLQ